MTDKLSLYNGALRILGERRLASLTEERKTRRLLDDAWDDSAVDYCLEQGQWYFAIRGSRFDYDPDYTAQFGYQRAFKKPDDWISTAAVCSDEYYNVPLTQYADEAGFWYCDLDTIYVKYVSNDADYGNNYAGWSDSFQNFVQAYLAAQVAPAVLQNDTKEKKIEDGVRKALLKARSNSAMQEPTKFMPRGSWTRSRMGRYGLFYERQEQR